MVNTGPEFFVIRPLADGTVIIALGSTSQHVQNDTRRGHSVPAALGHDNMENHTRHSRHIAAERTPRQRDENDTRRGRTVPTPSVHDNMENHARHLRHITTGGSSRPTPVFLGPSLFPEAIPTIPPPIGFGMSPLWTMNPSIPSPHHANIEPNPESGRPSTRSHRRHARRDISPPLDPDEDGYDSDIALATALSLSLDISGSTSMPPDGIVPSSDSRNHRSRRSRHSRRREARRRENRDQNRTTSDSSQAQCPICLEDMTGRATVGAPCGHMLCRTCRASLINSSDSWPKCHMCRMPYAA